MGADHPDPQRSADPSPADLPLSRKDPHEEKGSDVEKPLQEGSEPKASEQSPKETERKPSNGSEGSEPEGDSGAPDSREGKARPRDGSPDGPGPSSEDERAGGQQRKRKSHDTGDSSDSDSERARGGRRHQRRHPGRGKRSRARSPGDRPPPLRRSLVTSLRSMSEAIYQDVVQVQRRQVQAPLAWEHLATLAQLRAPLHALLQSIYTMASQAAYAIPAEGWLAPGPPPGGPDQPGAQDGGEVSPGSERSPPLALETGEAGAVSGQAGGRSEVETRLSTGSARLGGGR